LFFRRPCNEIASQYYGSIEQNLFAEKNAMRAFVLAVLIGVFDTRAHAQPLQIKGIFGFLGEYELSATVTRETSGREQRLTGPMTIRHVGLCTHNEPNESQGEITVQVIDTKSKISAAFAFDGQQCTYKGRVSQENVGELICSGDTIPFSIWFKK
jgi:hypothetical protein